MSDVNILGTRVAAISVPQLLQLVSRWCGETRRRTIMYANAHCLNLAYQNPDYQAILNSADLVYADGIGVVWAGRILGGPALHKATGTLWIKPFSQLAAAEGLRIYILAGRPGVAENARARLEAGWPGIRVAGTADGYFQGQSEAATIAAINAARPDILFIGRGAPLQERWTARHRQEIEATICWTVGSLFDQLTGVEPWPPAWTNALALQWLWRLLMDPAGKWQRYLIGNPIFVSRVLRQKLLRPVTKFTN